MIEYVEYGFTALTFTDESSLVARYLFSFSFLTTSYFLGLAISPVKISGTSSSTIFRI